MPKPLGSLTSADLYDLDDVSCEELPQSLPSHMNTASPTSYPLPTDNLHLHENENTPLKGQGSKRSSQLNPRHYLMNNEGREYPDSWPAYFENAALNNCKEGRKSCDGAIENGWSLNVSNEIDNQSVSAKKAWGDSWGGKTTPVQNIERINLGLNELNEMSKELVGASPVKELITKREPISAFDLAVPDEGIQIDSTTTVTTVTNVIECCDDLEVLEDEDEEDDENVSKGIKTVTFDDNDQFKELPPKSKSKIHKKFFKTIGKVIKSPMKLYSKSKALQSSSSRSHSLQEISKQDDSHNTNTESKLSEKSPDAENDIKQCSSDNNIASTKTEAAKRNSLSYSAEAGPRWESTRAYRRRQNLRNKINLCEPIKVDDMPSDKEAPAKTRNLTEMFAAVPGI